MTINNNNKEVSLKPETRNHKGFFIQQGDYKLMSIDESGWALICLDDAVCHYVDPDNLEQIKELVKESATAQK
ncbi:MULTISPECIES: hypothetical protein [Okeania]|uniref:Uncharacterized protein n=1 Tax=Okeania hirsuta TaxID=1458930 RepID=A0A3N6NHF2_9CYAN|nr:MULTISPECIES: hypothetical protein [Okeania]NEP40322.1 hypothetical protein [Okeania sp. SIO2H7]NES72441.1 hypothetical protein [Okeania sp. SIO2D1]NET13570.1 hypothetical protein [Okeania sp. SIO1H6]NEP73604.1 hypothetical protein [Okeania sp. SIO2G5]NEP87443.1 hypothetical protein [Okeania sp. SIO2C2]